MAYVKQRLQEVDEECLWPWHFPEVAATEEQLRSVETYLGHDLDVRYRLFLMHANGWQSFYHDVDLFGTEDLLGNLKMSRACKLLDAIGDIPGKDYTLFRREVLPIAVSENDIDLFVIVLPPSPLAGTILWLAGYEVDRFPNFDEYFLAMVDYNREEIQDLVRENCNPSDRNDEATRN